MRDFNNTVTYRWFRDVWNKDDRACIDNYLTADTVAHGLGAEGKAVGIQAFKDFYDEFRSQFKDVQVTVANVMAEDDMECSLTYVKATHIDSGKPVDFHGICMARIEDGKIAEAWNAYDFLKMYQQVGYSLALS